MKLQNIKYVPINKVEISKANICKLKSFTLQTTEKQDFTIFLISMALIS